MGEAFHGSLASKCQRYFPLLASTAAKPPLVSPKNTRPPAVLRTPGIISFRRSCKRKLPCDLSRLQCKRAQHLHRWVDRIVDWRVATVVCLAIDAAVFHRHHVVEAGRRIVCGGIPVRCPSYRGAGLHTPGCSLVVRQQLWPSIGSDATGPGQLLDHRSCL